VILPLGKLETSIWNEGSRHTDTYDIKFALASIHSICMTMNNVIVGQNSCACSEIKGDKDVDLTGSINSL
jgi:hypothetical protein